MNIFETFQRAVMKVLSFLIFLLSQFLHVHTLSHSSQRLSVLMSLACWGEQIRSCLDISAALKIL